MLDFDALVAKAVEQKASDIHLCPQVPAFLRVAGEIVPVGESVPSHDIDRLLSIFLNSTQMDWLHKRRQVDFMFQTPQGNRLRGNAFQTHHGPALCFRLVEKDIKPYRELGFPDFMKKKILGLKQGLVLIVGPTGQGKSTTLASVLRERNENIAEHLVTLEDPIEFIIESGKGLVQQREIGRDVLDYESGIRAAMREDPNVIMVGELRDPQTMEATLVLAETGHLVFGTLHTNSSEHTISRILDSMPSEQVPQVKSQLAQNLKMVIAQRLIPLKNGQGRVLSYEIMNMNYAIANHIREDKVHQIHNTIQTDQSGEMIQFEQSLASLVLNDYVSVNTAFEYARDKAQLKAILEFNGVDLSSVDQADVEDAPPAEVAVPPQ